MIDVRRGTRTNPCKRNCSKSSMRNRCSSSNRSSRASSILKKIRECLVKPRPSVSFRTRLHTSIMNLWWEDWEKNFSIGPLHSCLWSQETKSSISAIYPSLSMFFTGNNNNNKITLKWCFRAKRPSPFAVSITMVKSSSVSLQEMFMTHPSSFSSKLRPEIQSMHSLMKFANFVARGRANGGHRGFWPKSTLASVLVVRSNTKVFCCMFVLLL